MTNLIVILGPTGVGKTELCLSIAERLGCDIINCDSRQIYREIPIGTAAPTAQQQLRVRHYFVGSLSLTDYYSASMYEQDALRVIAKAETENIILSGGSMMYIDAVCNGIDDIPTIGEELRQQLKDRLETEGLEQLCMELKTLDPEYYDIVDRQNPRRILHALEICIQTGKTYTSFRKKEKKQRPFRVIKIGLTRDREELYERINQRVVDMIADGMVEEARSVYHMRELNSLNTVGYKELFEHFDGKTTLDEAIFKIQSNTRRYMRKQETWFKRDNDIKWFNPTEVKEIIKYIEKELNNE